MIAGALACLFFGDSTAVGTAQAFNRTATTPCAVVARIGARTETWPIGARRRSRSGPPLSPPAPIVRLRRLSRPTLRASDPACTRAVIWLLPYDRGAATIVERVAQSYRDYVLDLAELPTGDRLHPHSYVGIATALRAGGSPVIDRP